MTFTKEHYKRHHLFSFPFTLNSNLAKMFYNGITVYLRNGATVKSIVINPSLPFEVLMDVIEEVFLIPKMNQKVMSKGMRIGTLTYNKDAFRSIHECGIHSGNQLHVAQIHYNSPV